jgi:acetyl esterase/lipase
MLAASRAEPAPAPARRVEARRRMLEGLTRLAGEDGPGEVAAHDLQAPGPAGPIRLRLYRPAGGATAALVYLHGGGWVAGGLETHDGLCRRLTASSGVACIAVDYRLAPEHRFPAAFEDALAAACWTARHAEALGFDPRRLGVGGDSAGGGLAAAVAQCADAPPLALQVLLCPILDVANESPSRRAFAKGFLADAATLAQDLGDYCGGEVDIRDPRLSPLLAADLSRQPPALIHAAEYDPFRDEAQAYAERLTQAGSRARFVLWPGMIHYFYTLPRVIAGAGEALDVIGAGIGEALAGQADQSLSSPRAMRS